MTNEMVNTSGTGKNTKVPEAVLGHFNWGAFLGTWIWGLGNNTYITLLMFISVIAAIIPVIGFIVPLGLAIWFGIKGNEWAWQNKKFESVKKFHEYQVLWAKIGIGIVAVLAVLQFLALAQLAAAFLPYLKS